MKDVLKGLYLVGHHTRVRRSFLTTVALLSEMAATSGRSPPPDRDAPRTPPPPVTVPPTPAGFRSDLLPNFCIVEALKAL